MSTPCRAISCGTAKTPILVLPDDICRRIPYAVAMACVHLAPAQRAGKAFIRGRTPRTRSRSPCATSARSCSAHRPVSAASSFGGRRERNRSPRSRASWRGNGQPIAAADNTDRRRAADRPAQRAAGRGGAGREQDTALLGGSRGGGGVRDDGHRFPQVHAYAAEHAGAALDITCQNWPAHVTGDEMVAAMGRVGDRRHDLYLRRFRMYQYDASHAVSGPRGRRPSREKFALVAKPVNPERSGRRRRHRRSGRRFRVRSASTSS